MNELITIRERLKRKIRLHDAQLIAATGSRALTVPTYRLPHKKKVTF